MKFLFPELTLGKRLLLYFAAAVCAILSFIAIVTGGFPGWIEIVLYVLSAVGCFYSCFYLAKNIKRSVRDKAAPVIMSNPYTKKIVTEYRTRTILFMIPGVFSNVLFAVFNGVIGFTGHSAWFGTMSAYYILLSVMRIGAVKKERQSRRIKDQGQRAREEIAVYKKNSILFLFMAFVLSGEVILLELSAGGKQYPGLTIYAAAAYSFYKIIMSTIQVIRVRRRKSPLLEIIRRIGHIDASVSILTLQTAMFASFGAGMEEKMIKMLNGTTGAIVCFIVLFMGIQGIRRAKNMKEEQEGKYYDQNFSCGG